MITGFVKNQNLNVTMTPAVGDTINYLTADFKFLTKDWNGADIWAHFKQGGTVYDVNLIDGKIPAEKGLNLAAGEWEIYLHGSKPGQRITTNIVKINVDKTGVLNGEPLPEIAPSAAEQIAQKADSAEKIAKDVERRANEGEFKGDTGGLYYPEMHIDENGNLIVEGIVDNSSIDFRINNKDLEVIING